MQYRRIQFRRLYLWLALFGFSSFVFSIPASAQDPATIAVHDINGKIVHPLVDPGDIVVLVFLRRDCPVSSRYAPVIQKISQQVGERSAANVKFWLVFPDKLDSTQAIRKYLADYDYHLPALLDHEDQLVKLSHVQITPEVAVFGRNRQLVYDGRIDDWYVTLGSSRPAPTTHELEDAIRAAETGNLAPKSEVRGVGCYISDLQ
jgi:hypothetical protein